MKESFEKNGNQNVLVYELQPEDRLEGQSLRARANKKIEGVAPAAFSQVGNTKFIRQFLLGKARLGTGILHCNIFPHVIPALSEDAQSNADLPAKRN